MANKDRTAGLIPVKHLNGNPWNGKANMYSINAANTPAIFIGDLVRSDNTYSADTTGKYPGIYQATAGGAVRGVVIGFSDQPYMAFDTSDLNRKYCPALKAMYALVVDDPDVLFEIQEDSDGGNISADSIGLNCDVTVDTSGDINSGISGMKLDSSDVSVDGDHQLRVIRVVNRDDNALGTNCKFLVKINEHELSAGTVGI